MSRKKAAKKQAVPEQSTSTAIVETVATDDGANEYMPVSRPSWIDGAPVSTDGQFIREGSPQPTPQMDLATQAEGGQLQQSEPPEEEHGKNWGPPYKSIFSCPEMGFELGENRRFKQRVFRFTEKPTAEILAELKENGFTYRAAEKAWTVNATPGSRKLTDDLARKWAGPNYIQGVER